MNRYIRLTKVLIERRLLSIKHKLIDWGWIKGQNQYQKFIILCRGRVGSNLLRSYLNSHPSIVAFGELYSDEAVDKRMMEESPQEYLHTHIYMDFENDIKAVGFKLFYWHLEEEMWEYLKGIKDLKIIHLKRKNILRTFLSKKIADRTKKWEQVGRINAVDTKDKRMVLDYTECIAAFEENRNWELEFDDFFRQHQMLQVSYEEMVDSAIKINDELQSFLGVSKQKLQAHLTKQNPEPLNNLILNYSELKKKFSNTEWAAFFEN